MSKEEIEVKIETLMIEGKTLLKTTTAHFKDDHKIKKLESIRAEVQGLRIALKALNS
jgi:hypothetical protein